MNDTMKMGPPGALMAGMDADGGVHVIQTDTQGRVLVSPESQHVPHGLNGGAGVCLLLILFMVSILVGRAFR
jgi:hypothetical protein